MKFEMPLKFIILYALVVGVILMMFFYAMRMTSCVDVINQMNGTIDVCLMCNALEKAGVITIGPGANPKYPTPTFVLK